eukprot:CAMPEP_0206620692 /NCGR_PEP_ID=MMETSP0325_2-20121206/61759_1 /ASSEMBLY_ACC=CAM_ASM_000347 /TAXON_ID=2866 /ORGANISM="Crypthecodinium cohnii, Strain Seligo" /LENGTH=74 /DNA_ID=CAMNT_0054143669 /DNA_START=767 /DNA_END=991 /DNA_ORIENTATION=+
MTKVELEISVTRPSTTAMTVIQGPTPYNASPVSFFMTVLASTNAGITCMPPMATICITKKRNCMCMSSALLAMS